LTGLGTKAGIGSSEVALAALLALGGAESYVDQENIAVFCYRLAPQQFAWQRYPYPNLESARVALMHLQHPSKEPWVRRPKRLSRDWALTAAGVERAVKAAESLLGRRFENAEQAIVALKGVEVEGLLTRAPQGERRPGRKELTAVENHRVFVAWKSGTDLEEFERWELAEALGCLPDSPSWIWEERAERLGALSAQWGVPDVRQFVDAVLGIMRVTRPAAGNVPAAAASSEGRTGSRASRLEVEGRRDSTG